MKFPHRVVRRLPEESVTAGMVVNGLGYGEPFESSVQLTPTTAESAFKNFGLELARPHFLCWQGSGSDFPVGTLLENSAGRFFIVSAPARVYDFGNVSDHCDSIASELQYELASFTRDGQSSDFLARAYTVGSLSSGGDPV